MAMKYKANFTYVSDVASRYDVPVKLFRVWGGTTRDINLNSTDDISISSEMEQARFHNSISLGILPVGEAAIEIINLAVFKKPLRVQFVVERYSGRKMFEGLALFKEDAEFTRIPYHENNLLFIDLIILDARLFRGKMIRNFVYEGKTYPTFFSGKEV